MKIGVIGTGYVGLVQGAVLAEFGHHVICMDSDSNKISNLNRGTVDIYEPGLSELLEKNKRTKNLHFTTDLEKTIRESTVVFVAVGTPPREDGSADLKYVVDVAKNIGNFIEDYKVIVVKSTVPVGTCKMVKEIIRGNVEQLGKHLDFDVVSNPEFLREGKALSDCFNPERVIIGVESDRALEIMNAVYCNLIDKGTPVVYTNLETSEMIKYASNAFLAVKISFINEMALVAEKVGADVERIAQAMGMDSRISPKFLRVGPGYGGSCFPKDTRAIVETGRRLGEELYVVDAAIRANEKQKEKAFKKIIENMRGVKGKTIAILGLSFKPETDDVREAPSLHIIENLVRAGAKIKTYCPKGMKEAKSKLAHIDGYLNYCTNPYSACEGSHAITIVTEWKEFEKLDYRAIRNTMVDNYMFDLRNMFVNDHKIHKLFKYFPTGKQVERKIEKPSLESLLISGLARASQ